MPKRDIDDVIDELAGRVEPADSPSVILDDSLLEDIKRHSEKHLRVAAGTTPPPIGAADPTADTDRFARASQEASGEIDIADLAADLARELPRAPDESLELLDLDD